MPEERQEVLAVEGGIATGGTVTFDIPFTEVPKAVITAITNQIVSATITGGNKNGFTYVVRKRVNFLTWVDATNTIPIVWIAIKEK